MDQDWQEQVKKYDGAANEAENAGKFIQYPQICEITDICK
jgi:hypothetical protein